MASRPYSCDKDRLRLSLLDQLSEAQQAELEDHLESCPGCRQELEKLAAASHFWGDAHLLRGEAVPIRNGLRPPGVGAESSDGLDIDAEDGDLEGGWLQFLDAADSDRPDVLGRLGPYEVVEFLGRGGMGLVLKARDPALDRMVAIKVLTPALAHGAAARRRFAREARAVAAVGNEHIVAIHAVDEFRGLPYLVMQYVPGRSLQDRLDASGPLEIKEILRIGTQAARALAAAHAQGVVHRDIKPANILLENCIERVKLTDFGLARAIDEASVTQSGVIAGTPQYMAPEQARGEPVAAGADLFSLGAVLYAMATGRPPFRGDSAIAVLKRVCEIPHRPVRGINPDVPDWLEAVIDRLLAKDPADRFSTATEVADLLERGLAHLQQPATVPPPVVPSINRHSTQLLDFDPATVKALPRSSTRRRFALVAALLLLVVAGLGASEAAGLTQVSDFVATILRIKTAEGTLVIKCSDPSVKVQVDGQDVVIAGTGLQELRLKSGTHRLAVTKDGRPVREGVVSVARGGKEIVNVSLEATEPVRLAERNELRDMRTPASHAAQCLACHTNAHAMGADQPLPAGHPPIDSSFRLLPGQPLFNQCTTCHTNSRAMRFDQPLPAGHPVLDPGIRLLGDPLLVSRGSAANTAPGRLISGIPQSVRSRGPVWSLAFAPDGRHLVIGQQAEGGGKSTLRVWDRFKRSDVARFERGASAGFRCIAFSPGGRNLAAGGLDGSLAVFNTQLGQRSSFFHPLMGFDGSLAVFNTQGWSVYYEASNGSPISAVAFLPKSAIVAAGGWDGLVKFYHPTAKIDSAVVYPSSIDAIAISPDGSTLAVGGKAKVIQLYDVATFRLKATLKGHTHGIQSLDFSPDGKLLASAGGFTVRVWDVATGRTSGPHLHHAMEVLCVRYAPDGKVLAFCDGESGASPDKVMATEIVLWDVSGRNVVGRLEGHKGSIFALAFSPDGKVLASGSMDQTVKLWDVESGQLVETITPGESEKDEAKPAADPKQTDALRR